MRNLKKILALALVFAMAFAFTASAASFTDQAEIGANFVDDVNMLVELGVIAGYPDGSFGPQKNITRAEFSKMAYTLKYGSDADGNLFAAQASVFTDVQGNSNVAWAKGYINYCYNQKIVSGVGNNKFNPQGNITVAEATKMILVIMGCDPAKEGFTGANWMANVTAKAIDLGIYDGWAGDPTQLATRELVAKLMRNAVFSPVYEYSAISGLGSQMDALGQNYNQTLGEKTMGLFHIEGIVVANERYEIVTDEEGEDLDAQKAAATNDEEESVIYYTTKMMDGTEQAGYITIDRGLSDDMLGNKVDVYLTADVTKDNYGVITGYKNVEVMGNVIVNSDTVVYEVPAIAADVYPDGDSNSKTTVLPYIGFKTADETVTISVDKKADGIEKLAKSVDAQKNEAVKAAFAKYAYVFSGATVMNIDGDLEQAGADFIAEMGEPVLSTYRFVSVDGGKTFSYMFKDTAEDVVYTTVTNYSESKGTITLSGKGSIDLEDCVINGEIAVDDAVVAYVANGKIIVDKVDVITGAVDSFTDDGVIIGGNEYFAWAECDEIELGDTIFDYYSDNKKAMEAGTTYYVYGNLIMQIDADETAAAVENYAVIIRSYYDQDMDVAYVKLGFADNTEGTYQVGKTYLKNNREPNSDENEGNRAQDFAKNALFGAVVEYKIASNGTVDLSGQNFADEDFANYYERGNTVKAGVEDERFVWGDGSYYAYNDGTVVFALYGNPYYAADGEVYATGDIDDDGKQDIGSENDKYAPIKAKAYKLGELRDMAVKSIPNLYIEKTATANQLYGQISVASVKFNTNKGSNKYVVAGSLTVGDTLTGADISYRETNAIAYVVSAYQRYNAANDSYYADFTLISEKGLFTATTVEGVLGLNAQDALNDDVIGNISKKENAGDAGYYATGTFVRYELNADGKITTLDNEGIGDYSDIETDTSRMASGKLYLVNVVNERGGILSFYPTKSDVNLEGSPALSSYKFHEDGYDIIGIDDDAYVGESLTKVSSRSKDTLPAGEGNAIIEIDDDGIIRVFSFVDGWSNH